MTPENRYTAADYAEASVLAHELGGLMLSRLDLMSMQPKTIVDVGCGVGHCTRMASERYPLAQIFAVDASRALLRHAKQIHLSNATWLCSSSESLPFSASSVDLIIANLVLPWCDDLEKQFREWRRILHPNGLLMFTTFGPDTLRELKETSLALPNLMDMHDVGDALVRAGFADPVLDAEYFTMTYRECAKLFYELQVLGMIEGDTRDINLQCNSAGLIPLTYEVIYGHAWGPAQVKDETGTVKIALSELRRQLKG